MAFEIIFFYGSFSLDIQTTEIVERHQTIQRLATSVVRAVNEPSIHRVSNEFVISAVLVFPEQSRQVLFLGRQNNHLY
jgi:hypothetical protein